MTLKVFIHLDGSTATYEVKHEIDGIYKAVLLSKPVSHSFPENIILIRHGDNWSSDCANKPLNAGIVRKIIEHEQ